MALTTSSQIPCNTPTTAPYNLCRPTNHHFLLDPSSSWAHPRNRTSRRTLHLVSAVGKKLKTGKFDSRNRRGSSSTKEEELEGSGNGGSDAEETFEGYFLPELPGDEPDFWEGSQWDGLGFFVQYMWAFGILFAIISSGIAVATYNEGATDFKETPAYKESIQSRDLLEEPEASNADVFESNPTEEAPSLE